MVPAFLQYIDKIERETLQSALENFEATDYEELLEILDSHKCSRTPSATNIKQLLWEIAHKELIQQPMYVIKCWRPIISPKSQRISNEILVEKYRILEPTTRNIMKLLTFPEEMSCQQKKVSQYLKKYVKELDDKALRKFLRSDILLVDKININFHELQGSLFTRRPVAHTCGCVLELCLSYESLPDFRTEFNAVLASSIWQMDIH